MTNRLIDYVLQHRKQNDDNMAEMAVMQNRFERLLCDNGFLIIKKISIDDNCFTVLHCNEDCLQRQAEKMLLKMPLKEPKLDYSRWGLCAWLCNSKSRGCAAQCATDSEQGSMDASILFNAKRANMYKSYDEGNTTLFGPATRTLLVHSILSEMDVRTLLPESASESDNVLAKKGLAFLISKGIYTKAFHLSGDYAVQFPSPEVPARGIASTMPTISIVVDSLPSAATEGNAEPSTMPTIPNEVDSLPTTSNEESALPTATVEGEAMITASIEDGDCVVTEVNKFRLTWRKVFSFDFVNRVREHFGETMAFYYAWVTVTTHFLVILTCVGILSFALGFWLPCLGVQNTDSLCGNAAAQRNASLQTNIIAKVQEDPILDFVDEHVDNVFTLGYGLFLCLWGTCVLEAWKRQCAVLATMWHVDGCNVSELMRPQFKDVAADKCANGRPCNGIAQCSIFWWPLKVILMLAVALGAGFIAGILANTSSDISELTQRKFCKTTPALLCWPYVMSLLPGAVAIFITDKVYYYLARWFTDLENHITETKCSNALAIKVAILTAMNQFVPMYYVTFFQRNMISSTWWSIVPAEYRLHATPDEKCGRHDPCTPLLAYKFFLFTSLKLFLKTVYLGILMPLYRCLKECCKMRLDQCGRTKCCNKCYLACCKGCLEKCRRKFGKTSSFTGCCQDTRKRCGCVECMRTCCCFSVSCQRASTCYSFICCCCRCCHCDCSCRELTITSNDTANLSLKDVILLEMERESAEYWIIENYLEKVFLLGHVMMFSVSFPLVMFVFLPFYCLAHILDTLDLLQRKRRPKPVRTQDIGIWKNILELMNISGVVTTCILIGSMENRPLKTPEIDYLRYALLITVILVYLKGFVACNISKIPHFVVTAQREERYLLQNELRPSDPMNIDFSSNPLESPTAASADNMRESPTTAPADNPLESLTNAPADNQMESPARAPADSSL